MRGLQNIFQVLIKPGFLILFLFGFLGADCGRVTGGSDSTPPDTEQILAEQQAKIDAAAKAAEEAKARVEAARQTGDPAKVAEEERKQKEEEAETEKQQEIKTALQTAAPAVLRIYDAIKRVAAAKEQVAGTSFASGKPFAGLEEAVNTAKKEALKAFGAISRSEETSVAFDRAEEVALAANKADQQAQGAEKFVSGFQSLFTVHSHEKALFPSNMDRKYDTRFRTQCDNYVKEFLQSLPDGLNPDDGGPKVQPGCDIVKVNSNYTCYCAYDKGTEVFYKKQ